MIHTNFHQHYPRRIYEDDYQKILQVKERIMFDLSKSLSINQLADKANMSPTKFRSLFLEIFGMSIYQYHLNARIELSKQLLMNNELTIIQIAYKVGYNSSQSFAKAFKKHVGQTATDFKESFFKKPQSSHFGHAIWYQK